MTDYIPFKDTGYFSEFITDYLSEKEELRCLYHRFPTPSAFLAQLKEKQAHYSQEHRDILFQSLEKQYRMFAISEKTHTNIQFIKEKNTFTVLKKTAYNGPVQLKPVLFKGQPYMKISLSH